MKQLKDIFGRKTSIWLSLSLILVTIALWWTFDPMIVNTYVMRLPVGYDLDRIVKLEVASSVAVREIGSNGIVPTDDWFHDSEEQLMLSRVQELPEVEQAYRATSTPLGFGMVGSNSWFYHDAENEHVKSLSKLMDTYYKSVGRNSTLLLNFPIAPNGRIHPNDSLRGIAFKQMIDTVFKENLIENGKLKIENGAGAQAEGNYPLSIINYQLSWDTPTAFNRFLAEEDIAKGQRVRKFSLEAMVDGKWQTLRDELVTDGDGLTTIGHRRIICFPTVKATKLRFTINSYKQEPIIKKIGVYLAPELTADIPNSGEKKSSGLHIFFGSPQQMFIDWDAEQTISTFRYLPPQDTKDGIITHYTLWGSTDWNNWEKLATGEFSNIINNPIWQTIKFPAAKVRVLRFEADRLSSGTRMGYGDIEIK